jgi:multicomponent Na+:H+ antiporter subunit E
MKIVRTFVIHLLLDFLLIYLFFEITGWSVTFFRTFVLFIVFYSFIWLASSMYDREHFQKLPKIVGLFIYFFKELFFASMQIAWEVITPRHRMESGLIAIPLDVRTDFEITILATLISLTPGTLSLDVSEDRETLYVHAVYIKRGDIEALKNQIKFGFERRLLEITR